MQAEANRGQDGSRTVACLEDCAAVCACVAVRSAETLKLGIATELRTQPEGREREMATAKNPGVLYGIRRIMCVEVSKSEKLRMNLSGS